MSGEERASWLEVLLGVVLFLPIPLVLYLFVQQPRPLDRSLILGLVIMLAHRFVARPYMFRVAGRRSLWTGLPARARDGCVEIHLGRKNLSAAVKPKHRDRLLLFFGFLSRWRWVIRGGIFLPLLVLLTTLGMAATGRAVPLGSATALFQLCIGVTVVTTSVLWHWHKVPREPIRPAVPVHTFFLLGIVPLLWIFRIVGIWWILTALSYLFGW